MERTPLHWAARRGHAGCVVALLAAGASPSPKDEKGFTPSELAPPKEAGQEIREMLARAAKGERPDMPSSRELSSGPPQQKASQGDAVMGGRASLKEVGVVVWLLEGMLNRAWV